MLVAGGALASCAPSHGAERLSQAVSVVAADAAAPSRVRSAASREALLSPAPEAEEHHLVLLEDGRRVELPAEVSRGRRI